MFKVFSSMLTKGYDPVFTEIDFAVDVDKRRAHLKVAGLIEQRGEPIVNPVTGAEYRGRIDLPDGRLRIHARRNGARLDQDDGTDQARPRQFLRPVRELHSTRTA